VTARRGALLALVATLGLTSCVGSVNRDEFDDEVQSRGGGLGSELVADAIAALEEELGDDGLAVSSITFHASQATIEVLVPGTGGDVDSYNYGTSGLYGGGGLSEPTPVEVADAAALEGELFRVARLDIDAIDDMVDEAIEVADLDGGYARNGFVSRDGGQRVVVTITITNERTEVPVRFGADGRRLEAPL
jgi:hypothetical protein